MLLSGSVWEHKWALRSGVEKKTLAGGSVVLAAEFKRQHLNQTRWADTMIPLRRLVTGGAFKLDLSPP
jgi:hypothetical protein